MEDHHGEQIFLLLFLNSLTLYKDQFFSKVLKFIRAEKKFKNVDQLKKQIKLDVKTAKKINE